MSYKRHFKAHLLGPENETRIFIVYAPMTFNQLCEKLQELFPMMKSNPYTLYWKDKDGDEIVIKCPEEFKIFWDYNDMNVLNYVWSIYVKMAKPSEKPFLDVVHPNVVCDHCNQSIRGIRYKCLICTDYDLCSNCEKTGMHDHHFMIRICDHSRFLRLSKDYFKQIKRVIKSECDFHHHRHRGHHEKKHPTKGEEYSLVESFSQIMNNWSNVPNEETENAGSSSKKEDDKNKKETDNKKCTSQCLISQLNNILGNSLQFLDPLGINITVDVKDPNDSGTTTPNNSPSSENRSASPEKKSKFETDMNVDQSNSNNDNNEMENVGEHSNMDADTPKLIPEKMILETKENSEAEKSVAGGEKQSRSNEVEGWTLLNATEGTNGLASAFEQPSAPSTNESIYPNLLQSDYTHPDPKIQQALSIMKEMGFTNEGGWLTQLLITKNGEVSKALDVLCSNHN